MTSVDEREPAGGFPAASRDEWRDLVLGVLRKGGRDVADDADLDALLGTRTDDGVLLKPLYTAADTPTGAALGGGTPDATPAQPTRVTQQWDVRQRHAHPDPATSNAAILADLEHGVTSIWLTTSDVRRALDGVFLDLAPVAVDAVDAAEFLRLVDESGDPVAAGASLGAAPLWPDAVALARRALDHPGLRAVVADALPFHDAGASDAQELAGALAAGTTALRALTAGGLSVAQAADQVEFRYAATADQFATIAKLRAARRLWWRVTEVCGAPSEQRQHAVTSRAMHTRRDPWVNMLRSTVACFAAGVGGADSVTVLPFDTAVGVPDAFARRIARNTHALLVEESHVARVADPSGGSWFVESLTDELARRAWELFQRVEGGADLMADIAATWAARRARIARRRDALTGVSEFPDLDEKPLRRDAWPDGGSAPGAISYAQDFEALRDRADAVLAATGARPTVFLATRGPQARHGARAAFASNLFRAGGVETVAAGDTTTADALLAAYRAAGSPPVVCLCATDDEYVERAAAATAVLRDAGATTVLVAGGPHARSHPFPLAEGRDPFGADGAIALGCDAVAVLTRVHDLLDAARTEEARADAARTEEARADAARTEEARADAARTEEARADAARTDAAPTDTARAADDDGRAAGPPDGATPAGGDGANSEAPRG